MIYIYIYDTQRIVYNARNIARTHVLACAHASVRQLVEHCIVDLVAGGRDCTLPDLLGNASAIRYCYSILVRRSASPGPFGVESTIARAGWSFIWMYLCGLGALLDAGLGRLRTKTQKNIHIHMPV